MEKYNPEIEQALVTSRNVMPRLWWNIYQGCLTQGFGPRQAFALLQTYILSTGTNNVKPESLDGPKEDDLE